MILSNNSNYLSASREDENLIATATNANYQDYSVGLGGANGYTEIIEKTPTSVLLTNSTYSLCPVNQNDWQIDADQIELNLEKKIEDTQIMQLLNFMVSQYFIRQNIAGFFLAEAQAF